MLQFEHVKYAYFSINIEVNTEEQGIYLKV